jgi:GH24 family phage-related lysozyme (muramidase)
MQTISQLAVDRLTKPWEEFVAYPYDDKVPKQRGADGKRRYPEWTGGPLRGTLTIGYGHTDAAGPVLHYGAKIAPGMRLTEVEGSQLLAADMRPCCAEVDELVQVPLTQHQADALDDFVFNAGESLRHSTLLRKLNTGDYACVPSELMKFTLSRGEHMEGLVHRRQAEIAMWNLRDEAPAHVKQAAPLSPADHGVDDEQVFCPKADLPPARSPLDSKTVAAGGTIVSTGIAVASKGVDQLNQAAEPAKQAQDNLQQLGLWEPLTAFVSHNGFVIAGILAATLGAFVIWDRWRRLHEEAH